jgi:hypothetical protein
MPFGRRLIILGVAVPLPALAQKDGGTLGTPGNPGRVPPPQYAPAPYVPPAPRQGPPRTGATDADSGDSPGYGRRNVDRNRLPNRPRTGVTDADSNDSPGYGRRGVDTRRLPDRPRSGLTDADSGDSPGNGVGPRR